MELKPKSAEAEQLYLECTEAFGAAFDRLAGAYESDSDRRRDLIQEIHAALWLSLRAYDRRCSLRTWAYRVAHNTAASYVSRCIRHKALTYVDLEEAEGLPADGLDESGANQRIDLANLLNLIQRLRTIDRQVILLYLEGMDSEAIAETVGLSPTNVTTKISRIKKLLTEMLRKGGDKNAPRRVEPRNASGLASADARAVCVPSAT